MSTMNEIEQLAKEYAEHRDTLRASVGHLQDAIEAAKHTALPRIRRQVRAAIDARDQLHAAVDESRDLFTKPRTRTFSAVKVGLQKQKGKIEIDDEEACIKRIRAELPDDQAEMLIRTRESVDKNAMADLIVADIKRLGARVTDDTDKVIVKPVDGEVDKLVDALLGDVEADDEEAA